MANYPPADVCAASQIIPLALGWQLAQAAPGKCIDANDPAINNLVWEAMPVLGTVATVRQKDINVQSNFDASDWWYRLSFPRPRVGAGEPIYLRLEGLATIAGVWLNGVEILQSHNMFETHHVDVTASVRERNDLVMAFYSLSAALQQKRPRPRWKTALVEQQNLRWFRTTLLGRMPGWTPPVTTVGPCGPVALMCMHKVMLQSIDLQTWAEADSGRITVRATAIHGDETGLVAARLRVGAQSFELTMSETNRDESSAEKVRQVYGNRQIVHGDFSIANAPLWWPHTHGTPTLLPCAIELRIGDAWHEISLGKIGFKQLDIDQRNDGVRILVNGVPVFCRGACWTTMDVIALKASTDALLEALHTAKSAGINMLRVIGTMVYETDSFYALCDELGIMVWQDFMFANMDYPVADTGFRALIASEVEQQLNRLQRHPCVAVYCGGSEIAQQAAMMGLPEADWTNDFFADQLPKLCSSRHHGIPYFPSTPWGGTLPIHVATGISHYYGVGAYRRPIKDVKSASVRFASECLGFSNVPEQTTIDAMHSGTKLVPHNPRWKARVPRDNGAGWDFEDIRDFYLHQLFHLDPIKLRSEDVDRYYVLSRIVTGEVMKQAYAEWRRPDRTVTQDCGGALVWFYRDLWPGAGWGITDSFGMPKAAYWYLKRAWVTQAVFFTDEGLDGLKVHVINESSSPLNATVEITLLQSIRKSAHQVSAIEVVGKPRQSLSLQVDAILGYFSDSTVAYRFGPPKHDVVGVRLRQQVSGAVISEDYYFPTGHSLPMHAQANVTAHAIFVKNGAVQVSVKTDVFLQAVNVSSKGFQPDDNYFHLAPGHEKMLLFTQLAAQKNNADAAQFKAIFEAANLLEPIIIRAAAPAP